MRMLFLQYTHVMSLVCSPCEEMSHKAKVTSALTVNTKFRLQVFKIFTEKARFLVSLKYLTVICATVLTFMCYRAHFYVYEKKKGQFKTRTFHNNIYNKKPRFRS